ncbi:hypothetical protein QBC39DRAFT_44121 [Podospora conica]|nr:hypothetical protein QBC39DRAFT_44121 [Schizothecium conicum]
MLVRDIKRLVLVVGPVLLFLFLGVALWDSEYAFRLRSQAGDFFSGTATTRPIPAAPAPGHNPPPPGQTPSHTHQESHRELFSLWTADKKYFPIKFGTQGTFNPNIIPHSTKDNTYIIVGQKATEPGIDPSFTFFEIGCEAVFVEGTLRCDVPAILPVAPTVGPPLYCEKQPGITGLLGLNIGPHDARLLYGPTKPYLLFGSNSMFTCFGMWLQDFRTLMDLGDSEKTTHGEHDDDFTRATELQRPPPFLGVEKNWFIFWDRDNTPHVHVDSFPTRVMAQLNPDGSVGKDLGPYAADQDSKCLAHFLPPLPARNESIHQATNSLRVTMCHRGECAPDENNTVIIAIIQHKKYYNYHGEYEPYVVAFRDRSPFEIFGISEKPLWIHGREYLPDGPDGREASEMFYVVSMNWKERGRNYHGYLDDEILLAFGIDDRGAGGMDVLAGDLLAGLGLCAEV